MPLKRCKPRFSVSQLHDEVQPAVNQLAGSRATDAKHPRAGRKHPESGRKHQKPRVCHQRKRENSRQSEGSSRQGTGTARKALPVIAEARALKTKMEAAMPNPERKERGIGVGAERESNCPERRGGKRPKHQKMGSRNGESEPCPRKRQRKRLPSRNRFCTKRHKPQNRLGSTESKTAGQNIEELQNSKTVADRKLQDVQQAIKVVAHLDAATAEKAKNEERIQVLGKRNAEIR